MRKGAKRLNTFPGLHATRGSAGRSPLQIKEWEQLGLAETQVQQSNAHGVPAGPQNLTLLEFLWPPSVVSKYRKLGSG